jgi:hypothetical protein
MVLLVLLGMLTCLALEELQELSFENLDASPTELIYIYYTRPNIQCPACEEFNSKVSSLSEYVPVKRINFFEHPYLASHFFPVLFPAFVLRHQKRSFHLEADTYSELAEILQSGAWRKLEPMRWYLETDSFLTKLYALSNYVFFGLMRRTYFIIDTTPNWLVMLVISCILVYMARSIYIIFTLPIQDPRKEK